jgi:hypothetical protein
MIKMKKIYIILSAAVLSVSLIGCQTNDAEEPKQQIEENIKEVDITEEHKNSEEEVVKVIDEFGEKLKLVSLMSPEDVLIESMQKEYGKYVTKELLDKWIANPLKAPGKLTSSPWPDRIEILEIEEIAEDIYKVEGEIVEVTSVKNEEARRKVTIEIEKVDDSWLIGEFNINEGSYEGCKYENIEYGFSLKLPKSWEEHTVFEEEWVSNDKSQTGVIVNIRHPRWTEEKPRQDIPIMIFTHEQWKLIEKEELSVGAAPIPPKYLGENDKYVFALPARYNFAFLEGYEEVEEIMANNPLEVIK